MIVTPLTSFKSNLENRLHSEDIPGLKIVLDAPFYEFHLLT